MNAFALPERWGTAWRHPLVLAAMAAAGALGLATTGATATGVTTAFFLAVLVALAVIDVQQRILPNAIVVPSAVAVLAAHVALEPSRATSWTAAAFGAAGVLLLLHLVNPRGMGMGDVKLAFLLGAGLGGDVVTAFLIASVAVWAVALYTLTKRRAIRDMTIAFGPFLAFGAFAAVVLA